MKILFTTGIFKPELGGPATFSAEMATRLSAAGHTITVITYSDKPHFPGDSDYSFKLIRVVRSRKLINYIKYFLCVLKEAPRHDFIYSLDWFSAGMPVCAASYITKKQYMVRVGGGYIWEKYLLEGKRPVTLKEFYEQGIHKKYKLMYYIIRAVLNRAHTVVFNSLEQRKLYEIFYNLNPQKTVTIFNATPEHKFGILLKTYKKTIALSERDKEIIFAGRFIVMKNVESLVRAFAKLTDYSYKLILIGEGPIESKLRALVEELKISHRVSFLPPMSQRELYRRIANCAYVVIPSWTDISPHQVYECLAQGIPFLLTKENYLSINTIDFLKINPHSVDDIAEKMNWLLDPEHYDAFVKSLSLITYTHPWDNVVQEHIKLFRQLTPLPEYHERH